uniref:DUF6519 domain-containing protein n=1 Tax=Methylogaea oryzae TaxID=1295382 RepID=UPI000AA996C5
GEGGFALEWDGQAAALKIGAGRYYVDGWLVENHDQNCLYTAQKDYPLPDDDALLLELKKNTGQWFWVYLDVWERHITPLEQDSIREAALNGVDTCTRAKVVWQVKALPVKGGARSPPTRPSC